MRNSFEITNDCKKVSVLDVVNDTTGRCDWKSISELPDGSTINTHCPFCRSLLCTTKELILRSEPMRCPHCHQFFAYELKKK